MKLSNKISLIIASLVLAVAGSIGITALLVASKILEESANESLEAQAVLGADLIGNSMHAQLDILQELANRVQTRTMEMGIQRANLLPEITNHGYMDLAIVTRNGQAHYIKDQTTSNLVDRDYVRKALAGEQAISDVLISRVIGKPVVMFAVPITDSTGTVLGALIARKDGTALTETIKNVKLGETGYSYMVNREGVFVAHPDSNLVLSQFNPITEVAHDPTVASLAMAITAVIQNEHGYITYAYKDKTMQAGFMPVAGFPWIMFVTMEQQRLLQGISRLTRIIMFFTVLFVGIGAFLAFLLGRSIAKPILSVTHTLKAISEEGGDLTATVKVNSKDEIGDLARYFNATLGKIKDLVLTIKNQAATMLDIGRELAVSMTETAAAVNKITANIHGIKDQMLNQSSSVSETNATMEQITLHIDHLNENVEKQTGSVSQSSSAIEEMIANINSVTQTLTKNTESVADLLEASGIGRTGLQAVATDIQEIAKESEGLLQINAVMQNIASQTNLLSMNAAIEAAHAGEAGKGFAVVSDEIRKLAESSGAQSKTISAVLKKIKDSIDKISKSTGNVLDKFEAIENAVNTVSEQTGNIRSAMEEQSLGSRQILEVIGRLNDITQLVTGGSDEMREGSREVIREGKSLEMTTVEITNGVNEMAAGAAEINIAVTQVNEISSKNKENIDILVEEVSRFKVD
jgi:methyl-accepting chemotaxis protein